MRIIGLIALATIGFPLAGCYTLQPAAGVTPQVGTKIALDVTDIGRVALGGSMGPEIAQVEGQLLSMEADGSDYVLAVSAVRLLRGGEVVWRGEQVHFKPGYISNVYFRQYSPARTIALSGAAIGAVAILAGTSLLGSGSESHGPSACDTCVVARRIPRPRILPPHGMHYTLPPVTTP